MHHAAVREVPFGSRRLPTCLVSASRALPRPAGAELRAIGERWWALVSHRLSPAPVRRAECIRARPLDAEAIAALWGIGRAAGSGPPGTRETEELALRVLFKVALDLHLIRAATEGTEREEIDGLLDDIDACIRRIRAAALARTRPG